MDFKAAGPGVGGSSTPLPLALEATLPTLQHSRPMPPCTQIPWLEITTLSSAPSPKLLHCVAKPHSQFKVTGSLRVLGRCKVLLSESPLPTPGLLHLLSTDAHQPLAKPKPLTTGKEGLVRTEAPGPLPTEPSLTLRPEVNRPLLTNNSQKA